MRPAVAVVEDAALMRDSFSLLMPGLDVVAAVASVEELMDRRPVVDVVLLDLHLANLEQPDVRQGIAAVRALTGCGYRVCVYSQEERRFVLAACVAAGASGVVSKALPTDRAQQLFVEVASGGTVMPQSVVGILEVLVRRDCITLLSERQRQVLHGRARGLSYAQVARQLFVSESTLRGYWLDLTRSLSESLRSLTPSEIERALGLAPGDLLELWPADATDVKGWWRTARKPGPGR
ncbi:LuxR C-terminal-related transcriptional regulator [Micromonospora halophytica]|uniref:Two component transcriptional regulator, LuxR family n=1 Tax=Micromonospora halophytica TaxID=47864 RepID=A0A1C5IVG7_9ACTN|nr:LuxR C-terminal-related transcriptional regulator [Micromonospora halophytica]SCG62320.1 two component transcriptional regulator, LuxR family [Micromonospora halophytica]